MAREHHCPNCGAQACNASTSKIHTCGVCAAIWEEDLAVPAPAPVAPKPAAPATPAAAPKPAAPAPPPTAPPKPASPSPPPAAPGAIAAAPKPPTPAPAPAAKPTPPANAAPAPVPTPASAGAPAAAKPAPPSAAVPATPPAPPAPAPPAAAEPAPGPATPGGKTLGEVLADAKVKRCPKCQSDGVALPSDFRMVQGRLVLADSQTYRAHEWYADTGELLAPAAPGAAPRPAASAALAAPVPRTSPST